jgi:hypothetical protein
MKQMNFQCTLLTDIVISAQTATVGQNKSLNFIPGSNFLGIIASAIYKENNELNYDIFHSGMIRFGDAHYIHNNHRSFQVPFSWFYRKGGNISGGNIYMSDFISGEKHKELMDNGIVLEQARNGYFTLEGYCISHGKIFAQKTRHDPLKRRSLDSFMFGYEALQEGSEWQFTIEIDDELFKDNSVIDLIALIKDNLMGEKYLGRSKTSEYGRVIIDFIFDNEINTPSIIEPKVISIETRKKRNGSIEWEKSDHNLIFLYAESRLSFRDKDTGQSTFTPTAKDLGLPEDAEVLWEYSQIRTDSYAPWNGRRKCRDEDRVFIEKGSVITVDFNNIKETITTNEIMKGVGYYRAEGFGKMLVNPVFLSFEPETGKLILQLKNQQKHRSKTIPESENNDGDTSDQSRSLLINWLDQHKNFDEILKMVDDFIKTHGNKFSKVTNNQWGNIRSCAQAAKSKEILINQLFEKSEGKKPGGDLYHGIAEEQWYEGREILKEVINNMQKTDKVVLQFVEKLASRMQKEGGIR